MNYKVKVEEEEFELSNTVIDTLDLLNLGNKEYHLLQDNKAYKIKVVNSNYKDKTLTISINGNAYSIKIADAYDQMVADMGLLVNTSKKENQVKAPMPGLILDIMVEVGQEIIEGTPLLVLSAMKMENVLVSQGEGVIKSIEVKKEDAVEKGQLIIEME